MATPKVKEIKELSVIDGKRAQVLIADDIFDKMMKPLCFNKMLIHSSNLKAYINSAYYNYVTL